MNLTRKHITVTLLTLVAILCVMMAFATVGFADELAPGEKLGTWIMEQALWIAFAAIAVISIGFIIKKAWIPLVVFIIIAAVVLAIISDPARLQAVGEALFDVLGI